MATYRNSDLKFKPVVNPRQAGETITAIAQYTIDRNLANGDTIEMGALPAGCRLADFRTGRTDANPSATLDFGLLDGEYLADGDRDITSANALISATPEATRRAQANTDELAADEFKENDYVTRGLGFKVNAAQTAANGGTVTIIYSYFAVGDNAT